MKKTFTYLLFSFFCFWSCAESFAQVGLDFVLKAEEFKRSKNYDAALAEYDKAIKADPKNPEYTYRKGQVYYIKKDAENAIQYFEKTISLRQDYLNAYVGLARLYTLKSNNENALKAFESAFKYEEDKAKKIEYKMNIIKILYRLNRFKEAEVHIADALKIDPNNLSLLYYSAMLNNTLGKYEEAKNDMLKATSILKSDDPKEFAKYYYELGYAYYHLEKYNDARMALDKANYGPFKQLVFKMTPSYFYGMALAYFKIYDIEDSKRYLETALKMKPDFSQAHDLLLKIVAMKADKSAMIESMKRAVEYEKEPQKKAIGYANLCELQFNAGKYQDAVNSANACLAIQPQNTQIAFLKAIALYRSKKVDDAINALNILTKQATLDQEARAQYNFALGVMYSRSGKDAKIAENTLKKADYAGYKYAAMAEIESLSGQKTDDQPKLDTEIKIEGDN